MSAVPESAPAALSVSAPLIDQPTLADLQQYVEAMARVRGFNTENVSLKFMMLFEEVGEFAKAARTHAGGKLAHDAPDQSVTDEAADILFVLLTICNMLDIDLEKAFREKEVRNKQRTWHHPRGVSAS